MVERKMIKGRVKKHRRSSEDRKLGKLDRRKRSPKICVKRVTSVHF